MDRVAIFVDAAYVYACGAQLLSDEKLQRSELHIDHSGLLKLLQEIAEEQTGLPLLRVYWYDGCTNGPTPQQIALAYQPNVKLRLGYVNAQGQQKGVDSLLVADLINLSSQRAMADAVLFVGDEDVRIGVQQAQDRGVRVHLLGISPIKENQSATLVQEADTVRELSPNEVRSFLSRVQRPRSH